MTKREEEVYGYCMSYYMKNGVMPSMRDIGTELFISHVTAYRHMKSLESKGMIRFIHRNQRAVPSVQRFAQVAL